jgi:hypothetical protein
MTRDHDLERVLDRWFREGPTHAPDRLFDAFVDRIDRVPQRRLARLQTRLLHVNLRFAAAAAILVVVAGVGAVVLTQAPGVGVGSSPTPSAVPSPSRQAIVDPAALLSGWTSVGTRVTPFRNGSHTIMASRRVDIAIGDGDVRWDSRDDAISSKSLVGPGTLEFRVVSTSPAEWNCQLGDAGTYTFGLSTSGQNLTLTMVSDACAARAAVLAGDWIRTDMGNLAPGRHVSALFRPFGGGSTGHFSYTVPAGWTDGYECESCLWLARTNDLNSSLIEVLSNVVPNSQNKSCGDATAPVAGTAAQMANWLATLPGLIVTTPTPITIGGFSGVVVDLSLTRGWTNPCETSQSGSSPPVHDALVHTFHDQGSQSQDRILQDRGQARYILLDLDGGQTLLIDLEAPDKATWDALVREGMPIVEGFQFIRS